MKTHKQFVPKLRSNYLLIVSAVLMLVTAAAMWKFRSQLGLSLPDLMMITGVSLIMAVLTALNFLSGKKNYDSASALVKKQEDIGKGKYTDSSIFFRDEFDEEK